MTVRTVRRVAIVAAFVVVVRANWINWNRAQRAEKHVEDWKNIAQTHKWKVGERQDEVDRLTAALAEARGA